MARAVKKVRGGPGYAGLIVFISLCLVLILGYVFLVPDYARRGNVIETMNSTIKKSLEDPLSAELNISNAAPPGPTYAAYDTAFFAKVGEAAKKGIKFDEMAGFTGYTGETAIDDIKAELAKETPNPPTLREEFEVLRQKIATLEGLVSDANSTRDAARKDRDNALAAKAAAEARLKETLDAKNKEIDDIRQKDAKELADLKDLWQKADAAEKKAQADAVAREAELKQEIAGLGGEKKLLEQKVVSLQEELDRKKPKPVVTQEGTVLRANLSEGSAYISLGKNHGIGLQEKFTVMSVGKGGVRVPKGEVQVVSVYPEFARVDILGPAFQSPIIAGDIVVRQKQFEDTTETAAAAK